MTILPQTATCLAAVLNILYPEHSRLKVLA